ncbi:MAG: glycoside hydrolase family 88 protein [Vibrio sp.]
MKINKELINDLNEKLKFQLNQFDGKYPAACSEDNVYPLTINTDWTTGFWSGMTSIAYDLSGDVYFKEQLQLQVQSFTERAKANYELNTHDIGFLYTLSCVNPWRSFKNKEARSSALLAADLLMERFHPKAGIIQAWGDLNDPTQQGRMIIDCLLNLPLLYWAAEETGDRKYYDYAYSHAQQACNFLLRSDYSTYHTFYMDTVTGEPVRGCTHQGFSDESCWARGQAWAIYGFILSYKYTGDRKFLDASINSANYFIKHLPEDDICFWDLSLKDTYRDSSAAAIAACGLLELAKSISILDPNHEHFNQVALKIADVLIDKYFDKELNHGGYLKHSVYNLNKGRGVDEYCTWGDYFFFELLSRLSKPINKYW